LISSSPQILYKSNDFLDLTSQPISAEEILNDLYPPKHFEKAEFSTYIPEIEYPSQAYALDSVSKFVRDIHSPKKTSIKRFWKAGNSEGNGLYLDGGFGVGKTHLLAAAYHGFSEIKAYLSFQELMFLVGLQSLAGVADSFKNFQLLVIDEFELDDPANTRIASNLLGQLLDSGVSILASSNTPPGALGEGKFSVDDFKRELGNLTKRFKTVRIDGEDYRHTHHLDSGSGSTWVSSENEIDVLSVSIDTGAILDITFKDFLLALSKAHPMRIRRAIGKIDAIILRNVEQITHPHEALRFVYFIDKAYDNDLLLLANASIEIKDLFQRSYFSGGDTKKYLRTMSRLHEMTQTGFLRLHV
jgi:cell division protein ZapE